MKTIGWRMEQDKYGRPQAWYVTHLPGDGGKDWGYGHSDTTAIHLSQYWQRRFLSDMRHVNRDGHLLTFHA